MGQRDRTDAELQDRERAVKDRELSRRERRQDGYDADADGGQVEDTGEPLSAFEMPMDGSDLDLAPTAMLQRRGWRDVTLRWQAQFPVWDAWERQILARIVRHP